MVQVELRPFDDRVLNRDLAILCGRANQASPRFPDRRQLSFTMLLRSCCTESGQNTGLPVQEALESRHSQE